MKLTVAARESMIVKRDSARELSISSRKFVAAMAVAAFSSAVGPPRTGPWRLRSLLGLGSLLALLSDDGRLGV